jgi:UDP-3-O-[3-hydroxymyristoyl] glucosamine N-acyltransferase
VLGVLENIITGLRGEVVELKGKKGLEVRGFSSFNSLTSGSISFLKKIDETAITKINDFQKVVIICSPDSFSDKLNTKDNAYILVANPRLFFIKLLTVCTKSKNQGEIHPSAVIHQDAIVHKTALIGANCSIGACEIGENAIIKANVSIGDKVKIGSNVIIHSGAVVGSDGFGFEKDEKSGEYFKFPHIGGVIIGDDVEIGSNTSIDRATLDFTIISNKVKIDNQVHIAHNVSIGENTLITANAMIAGSAKVGADTWIAPSASILNGISIGKKCFIGMGSVVIRDVDDNTTVVGSPARSLSDFRKLMKFQTKLLNES